jgi:hypothetical protein
MPAVRALINRQILNSGDKWSLSLLIAEYVDTINRAAVISAAVIGRAVLTDL